MNEFETERAKRIDKLVKHALKQDGFKLKDHKIIDEQVTSSIYLTIKIMILTKDDHRFLMSIYHVEKEFELAEGFYELIPVKNFVFETVVDSKRLKTAKKLKRQSRSTECRLYCDEYGLDYKTL